MDLKGTWQGRHIRGGTTTYPFTAKFDQMPSGYYVLQLNADDSLPSSRTPYTSSYANRMDGIVHSKDTFEAVIDKHRKVPGTSLSPAAIEEDYLKVYRIQGVSTFWLHLDHKNEKKIVVFRRNSPKPVNDVPKVTKSANPMNVNGFFWGRWYKSAAHYDEGLPIFNWAAALLQDETQTYYLDLLAMTGGPAGSMPKPTTEGYRFRLKHVTHGENTLKAAFSTDPPPKKQQQPYDRVHTADPLVVTRDNSPNKRPEFILYIEGHKIIFTMNHPPSSSELRGAYEAPKASGPPTSGPSTLRKPGANAPRNVKRVGASAGTYTADARVPAVDRTAHTSYPRDEHIPGTYKNVTVKSKTRECVKNKAALSKPDEITGERRPLLKKNGEPVLRCEQWRQIAPRTHHIQGGTVHEAPATKRRRTVSATSRPKREVHMVNDPYGTCEKRYVGACVPQARLDAYYAKEYAAVP